VSNEASRKNWETQRKAVLWSRKVFKALPETKRIFNTCGVDCGILRRFACQGL